MTIQNSRLPDETILDYKIRLCQDKDRLTWAEIAALVSEASGEEIKNSDTIRKWFSNFNAGIQYAIRTNATTNSELVALDQKTMALELERRKKASVSVAYNKVLREEARRELFWEAVQDAIGTVKPPTFNDLPVNIGKRGALLGIADIHYGKYYTSINNKYSEQILLERMEVILNETIEICRKEKIDHLNVSNLGDSLEGIALRISQQQTLDTGMVDSTINFSRMIVEWLNKLSTEVKITYHHVNSANHTEIRPLGTSAGQFPAEDMERLIHMYVHDMLQNNKRIIVPEYDTPFSRFQICDSLIYAIHGHQFKGNMDSALKHLSMQHTEPIDYVIAGHIHHNVEKTVSVNKIKGTNQEVLVLPSVMGSDGFSDSIFSGARPGAKIYIFEELKGKVMGYDIKL